MKQKGQETVEDVKNFAAKDIDQTKADLQQAKDKANELKQKGEQALDDLKTNASDQYGESKAALSAKADELKEKLADTQHAAKEKLDHLKEEA
ncbi:hypothetical protein VXE41_19195, partial [Acinetobacter variabilis]